MLEVLDLLICLETIDQNAILSEKDTKSVIAEIGTAITSLVLSHKESAKLIRPSESDGSEDETISLDGSPRQLILVSRIMAERKELSSVEALVSPEYWETIVHVKSVKYITISKVVESLATSWNSVITGHAYGKKFYTEWSTVYHEAKDKARNGVLLLDDLVTGLIRIFRPTFAQVLSSMDTLRTTKQPKDGDMITFGKKLASLKAKHNRLCQFFRMRNWTIDDKEIFFTLCKGLNDESRSFLLERIIPDICKSKNKHPSQVTWANFEDVIESYSVDHLTGAHTTLKLEVNRMDQANQKKGKKTGKIKEYIETGVPKEVFIEWKNSNPNKCFFCLKDGHAFYNCRVAPGSTSYPSGHPFKDGGMPKEVSTKLVKRQKSNLVVKVSRMKLESEAPSAEHAETVVHDTGCLGLTVIGGFDGLDQRSMKQRIVNFSFGGQNPVSEKVRVGVLYLVELDEVGRPIAVLRTPAVGNPKCQGIFLSNQAFQGDGGMVVRESKLSFYRIEIPVVGDSFERDPVMKSYEVDINGELIGRFRRAKQEEIAHFAPRPMQLKVRNAAISAVLMNSMSGLPGRGTGELVYDEEDAGYGSDASIASTVEEFEMGNDELMELHLQLNHRSPEVIKQLIKDGVIEGVKTWTQDLEEQLESFCCEPCNAVKLKNQNRLPKLMQPRAYQPLQVIYMDSIEVPEEVDVGEFQSLVMLSNRVFPPIDDFKYILILVDEYSRYKFGLPVRSKAAPDVTAAVERWLLDTVPMLKARIVRNNPSYDVNKVLLELNSDFGTEFSNLGQNEFQEFLRRHRIAHNVSVADCQWQNGVAEGSIGHLKDAAAISLKVAGVGARYYPWAMNHVIHVANLLPTRAHGSEKSPYERMFGETPKLRNQPFFGQMVQYKIGSKKTGDGIRAARGFVIGRNVYVPGPPGHLIYNPSTKRVVIRQNIKLVPLKAETTIHLNALTGKVVQMQVNTELDFRAADEKELQGIAKNGTFGRMVTESEVKSGGADIVDTKMVREQKKDGTLKSRLCGRGFLQKEGHSFWSTFCPTPMLPSILTVIAMAAQFEWEIFGCDSTQAFLQPEIPAHMKGKILVRLPQDIEIEGFKAGEIRELNKLIYGTKQSAKVWFDHITRIILDYKSLGISEVSVSSKDLCVFFMFKEGKIVLVLVIMVDDIMGAGQEDVWTDFFTYLKTRVKVTGGGKVSVWNGLEIRKTADGYAVSQSKQIRNMLATIQSEFGELQSGVLTPESVASKQQSSKTQMQLDDETFDERTVNKFQTILGKVTYVSSRSRPDIAHATNRLGQVSHRASETNQLALDRLVGYLNTKSEKELYFRKGSAITMAVFADASFGNEEFFAQENDLGKKSTSGTVVLLNGAAVSWKSKLQSTVADSTGYAETIAAHEALKEVKYLKLFLEEMKIRIDPVPMFLDASNTVSNLLHCNSFKQNGVKFHELKVSAGYQYVREKLVHPILVRSTENIADALTKSLVCSGERFEQLTERYFGSQNFEEWIIGLIQNNFGNALSDVVPHMKEFIMQWLSNSR